MGRRRRKVHHLPARTGLTAGPGRLFRWTMTAGLGALAACATTSASRGVELDPSSVTAIELVPANGKATFCPGGAPTQLKAIVTTGGGRLETATDGQSSDRMLDVERLEW